MLFRSAEIKPDTRSISAGFPGQPKSARQLQASSGLFYEVFKKYDASNLLLTQAQTEVLSQELDIARLTATLNKISAHQIDYVDLKAPSPLCLPLMVERLREKLSTEKLADRLQRMVRDAQSVADG